MAEGKVYKWNMPTSCMEERLLEALKDLSRTLRRIENLSAWLEMERSERRETFDHSFRWQSSTEQDLKAEIGAFLNTYYDILELLGKSSPCLEAPMRERLRRVYCRFSKLAATIDL